MMVRSTAQTLNTVWCIKREIALASRQNINRSKRILCKTLHLNHERHVPHIDFNFFLPFLSFPCFLARSGYPDKKGKQNTHQNILMSMACYGYGHRIDSPSRVLSLDWISMNFLCLARVYWWLMKHLNALLTARNFAIYGIASNKI